MTSSEAKKIADVKSNNDGIIHNIVNDIRRIANSGNYEYVTLLNNNQIVKLSNLGYNVDKIDHECSVWCNCRGKYNNQYIISWNH